VGGTSKPYGECEAGVVMLIFSLPHSRDVCWLAVSVASALACGGQWYLMAWPLLGFSGGGGQSPDYCR